MSENCFSIINNLVSEVEEIMFEEHFYVIRHNNSLSENFQNKLDKNTIEYMADFFGFSDSELDDSNLVEMKYFFNSTWRRAGNTKHGILYRNPQDTNLGRDASDVHFKINSILTSFRIFKNQYISLYPITDFLSYPKYSNRLNARWSGNSLSRTSYYPLSHVSPSEEYTLELEESSKVIELYQIIVNKMPKNIQIAIDRFNRSYERYESVDTLLDIIIGLESLLKVSSEITYRISNRIAFLIGKDETEREEIFSFIKDAYSIRSRIVHGDYDSIEDTPVWKKRNEKNPKEFLIKLNETLRNSIKTILLEIPKEQINDKNFFELMDKSIIRGDNLELFIEVHK